jgi:hypothetical protein
MGRPDRSYAHSPSVGHPDFPESDHVNAIPKKYIATYSFLEDIPSEVVENLTINKPSHEKICFIFSF